MRVPRALGLALSLVFISCTVGPDFVRPHGKYDETYEKEEVSKKKFDPEVPVPSRWWSLFGSPKLDPLVQMALARNHDLQAAMARLKQSQFELQAGSGVFYPQINVAGQAQRARTSPQSVQTGTTGGIFNFFTLSGTISYVLDVFGSQRRAVEGLEAQVEVQRYTMLAAYLSLTANLVNSVIARAAYQAQLEATRELVRFQREQVTLTEKLVQGGTISAMNLLTLRTQLSSLEAEIPPLEKKKIQAEHLLASLSGFAPSQMEIPEIRLAELELPEVLPKVLPSQLVRQRPDILAAEAVVHASSAQMGVATAALFPSFNLSAVYGLADVVAGSGREGSSTFWSLGASVMAPIFRGGTLSAQKEAAVEAYKASLAIYRQTVLNAFSQVADFLRALEKDDEALRFLSKAVQEAKEAQDLVRANFKAGTVNYLQVLIANAQLRQSRIAWIQGVAQRFQDAVGLFAALGGGWWDVEKVPPESAT